MEQDYKIIFLSAGDDKWNQKKRKNVKYTQALQRLKVCKKDKIAITSKTIERVGACARYITFGVLPDGRRKIVRAKLCRNRFCPICMWRRTRKVGYENASILTEYKKSGGHLIFCTFTIPNCKYTKLKSTIKDLNKAIVKLRQREAIKRISLGDIKTVEVTVNYVDKTFHPHVHMIVAVPHDYFAPNNPDYLTHAKIQSIWQECMKSDRYLYVNIQAINDVCGSVYEISKYMVKDEDYISVNGDTDEKDEVLFYLYNQTKNLRFISYSGIFKNIRNDLKIQDIEEQSDSELLGLGSDVENNFLALENYIWHYGFSRYILSEYEEFNNIRN